MSLDSPYAAGFALGNLGVMANFIRKPEEKWGMSPGAMNEWFNVFFSTYFSAINANAGVQMPQDIWGEFAQGIFSLFVAMNHEQRFEFVRGLSTTLEVEKNYRAGETRETTATPIYFEMLLFWPEITRMKSLPEVFEFLQQRFSDTPAVLGDFVRFRKTANRIELSFREQIS